MLDCQRFNPIARKAGYTMFDLYVNFPHYTMETVCDGFAGLISYIENLDRAADDGITVIVARSVEGRLKGLLRLQRGNIDIACLDGCTGFEAELRQLGFSVVHR
jgi:hypothetical protein